MDDIEFWSTGTLKQKQKKLQIMCFNLCILTTLLVVPDIQEQNLMCREYWPQFAFLCIVWEVWEQDYTHTHTHKYHNNITMTILILYATFIKHFTCT